METARRETPSHNYTFKSLSYSVAALVRTYLSSSRTSLSRSAPVPRVSRIARFEPSLARVAKQRAEQVTRHWQTVGIPLESLGTERFPTLATLAACHGCGGKFRTLFHVKPEGGPAATKVTEEVVSAILERISERVEGEAEEGMRARLCHAMQGQGVLCAFVVQPLWSVRRACAGVNT